jgi:hypothetical protein
LSIKYGLSIYLYTTKSLFKAALGKSVNFFTKNIPSPPLPFEGLVINVWLGNYLIYSSSSYTSSGSRNDTGIKLNWSGKNLCSLLNMTHKTFFFAKCYSNINCSITYIH